jgi:hypothetical protein
MVFPPAVLWGDGLGSTIPIGEPQLDRFTLDAAIALATQLGVWIPLTKRAPGAAERPAALPD